MKWHVRLLLLLAAAYFAVGTQTTIAQTHRDPREDAKGRPSGGTAAGSGHKVGLTGPLAPFIPSNTVYASAMDNVGRSCNKDGSFNDSARFRCKEMLSAGVRYRVRQSNSEGYQAFIVHSGSLERYAELDASARVVFQSPAAQQVAQANGYRLNNGTSSMAAINEAPAAPAAAIDCKSSNLNINDRLACIKRGATGSVRN